METYCVKQRKKTGCVEPSGFTKTSNNRDIFFCTCAECGITKYRFVKASQVNKNQVN